VTHLVGGRQAKLFGVHRSLTERTHDRQFQGEGLVNRHRAVNKILAEELAGGVHALALHTMTPDEWFNKNGRSPDSPPCLGGDGTFKENT
jgi:hypothetical protein